MGKFPIECIFVGMNVLFSFVDAKMSHLLYHSFASRIWDDDLGLAKWALPGMPVSLDEVTKQFKFNHSSGLVALICSNLKMFKESRFL